MTSTAYVVGDVVQNSTLSYVCATAHTSGVFATDYAAGKWVVLGAEPITVASSITASAYGHIAATTVQAFLQELVDEKALLAGSASQVFSVADATDDAHALSMGQAQKASAIHGVAGGSSDALTLTLTSGLTTLSNGMTVYVEAGSANTTTAPTFNLTLGSTATGAKTIKKGAAAALVAGDIAGAGHKLVLQYYQTGDCWLLLNPAYAPGASTAGIEPDTIENAGIAFSVGSSALTATLKTASGGTPSSSDAVRAALRSSSASTGTYNTRSVTATASITIRSGDTLGHTDATEHPLHWYLIENGSGGLELAVSTKFHGYSGIVSTTAISGGALTSATTMYSTSARTNQPFIWLAKSLDTQTTAGTWASTPTSVTLVRRPQDNDGTDGYHPIAVLGTHLWLPPAARADRIINGQIVESHTGNAVTYTLKGKGGVDLSASNPCYLLFPSATLTSGDFDIVKVTANISVTVPSGATLGHASNIAQHSFIYAINNAGTAELAVSNLPPDYPGTFLAQRTITSTTVAAGSTSATGVYASTGRAGVVWIPIAKVKGTQVTAGQWAADPTQMDMAPFSLPGGYFKVHRNGAAQTIANSTMTTVQFTHEEYDTDGLFDNAINYRYQPNVAGLYVIHGGIHINSAQPDGSRVIARLIKTGSQYRDVAIVAGGTTNLGPPVDATIMLNGTSDYVSLQAYQEGGGNEDVSGNAPDTWLEGHRA